MLPGSGNEYAVRRNAQAPGAWTGRTAPGTTVSPLASVSARPRVERLEAAPPVPGVPTGKRARSAVAPQRNGAIAWRSSLSGSFMSRSSLVGLCAPGTMTLRTHRRRITSHRVLEDRFATAHTQPMGLETQRGRQRPKSIGDQIAQSHQRPVARQALAHRAHGGGATRQTAGDQADDPDKNIVDQADPAAHPAQRAGKLYRVRAQRVRCRLQAARFLGRDDNQFQIGQRPRKTRRQTVRQKAERRMALRAIPAGDTHTRRRLALIAPVTGQGTAAPRMVRAPFKPCGAPRPGADILLAGEPCLVAKLQSDHGPEGLDPARASFLFVLEPTLLSPPGNEKPPHRPADNLPEPSHAALGTRIRKSVQTRVRHGMRQASGAIAETERHIPVAEPQPGTGAGNGSDSEEYRPQSRAITAPACIASRMK